jgi:hypothetical protein
MLVYVIFHALCARLFWVGGAHTDEGAADCQFLAGQRKMQVALTSMGALAWYSLTTLLPFGQVSRSMEMRDSQTERTVVLFRLKNLMHMMKHN